MLFQVREEVIKLDVGVVVERKGDLEVEQGFAVLAGLDKIGGGAVVEIGFVGHVIDSGLDKLQRPAVIALFEMGL